MSLPPFPTWPRLFAPNPQAAKRTVEFFTANISNDHKLYDQRQDEISLNEVEKIAI